MSKNARDKASVDLIVTPALYTGETAVTAFLHPRNGSPQTKLAEVTYVGSGYHEARKRVVKMVVEQYPPFANLSIRKKTLFRTRCN